MSPRSIIRRIVLVASLLVAPSALAAPALDQAYATPLALRQKVAAANAKVDGAISAMLSARGPIERTQARSALASALKELDLAGKEWNDDWITRAKRVEADLQHANEALAAAKTDAEKAAAKARVAALTTQQSVLKLGNKEWNDDWLAPKSKVDAEVASASDAVVGVKLDAERAQALARLDAALKARAFVGAKLRSIPENW